MKTAGDFLDDRDRARAADAERRALNPAWQSAEPTKAPEALVESLLASINATFYVGRDAKAWLRDARDLKLLLTWPATWLTQRGVSLPVARYEAILREILEGVRQHGDLASIRHFPTYLGHVVRQWFIHNGEALYEERKRVRNQMDAALRLAQRASGGAAPDPVETLAAAHRVLAAGKRAAKPARDDGQLGLF